VSSEEVSAVVPSEIPSGAMSVSVARSEAWSSPLSPTVWSLGASAAWVSAMGASPVKSKVEESAPLFVVEESSQPEKRRGR